MRNLELESVIDKLRDLFASEYARGQKDQLERVIRAATSSSHTEKPTAPHNKPNGNHTARASKGAPDALIRRVLREAGSKGVSPMEIKDRAIDDERVISFSGIRFALVRGRGNGEYINHDGKWYLPKSDDAAS